MTNDDLKQHEQRGYDFIKSIAPLTAGHRCETLSNVLWDLAQTHQGFMGMLTRRTPDAWRLAAAQQKEIPGSNAFFAGAELAIREMEADNA